MLPGLDAPERFTLQAQVDCVEREIRKRRQVYPRQVAAGRLTQAKADYEIACMEAVLATLVTVRG